MADRFQYRELEHTGDLAIEVTAPSRAELFAGALVAMARLMVAGDGIEPRARREIAITADTDVDRLHDLLADALNLFLIDGFIWSAADVSEPNSSVTATLTGEKFDSKRHELIEEIKAVTYHCLAVEQTGDAWRATIIFDA